MKNDIIKCLNPFCGKEFKDTTKLKMQDSRDGKFVNMCPYCYGINTINTNENAKRKDKFKYNGTYETESHVKMNKYIKRPDLDTEHIAKEVLGQRKKCDVSEEDKEFAPSYARTLPKSEPDKTDDSYYQRYAATSFTSSMKPYTPQELKQQEINNRIEEMKSRPNNYNKYKRWGHKK